MADSWNPIIKQGETFVATITVTGVNLSGYIVRSKARRSHDATTTVWNVSTATSGISVSPGANSIVTMTLSATDTAAYTPWTVGVFDMEYESPAGVVTRFVQGYFTIVAEATK